MKAKGFTLNKVAVSLLLLALLAGTAVGFARPGGPKDPHTGFVAQSF